MSSVPPLNFVNFSGFFKHLSEDSEVVRPIGSCQVVFRNCLYCDMKRFGDTEWSEIRERGWRGYLATKWFCDQCNDRVQRYMLEVSEEEPFLDHIRNTMNKLHGLVQVSFNRHPSHI